MVLLLGFFCFVLFCLSPPPPPTTTPLRLQKKRKGKNARACVSERGKKKIPKESKFLFVPKNLDSRSHRNV